MNQLKYISGLWHGGICITNVLFAALMAVSSMSLAAPPGGSSGGSANTTLSDLGCAPGEIARVTDVEEWDCDPGMTAVEGQAADLDGRVATIESQNLDSRVSTIEGQSLDSRLSSAEGEVDSIDSRVSTMEGQNLDARIDQAFSANQDTRDYATFLDIRLRTLESQGLDIRLSGLEADDAGNRLDILESENLDSRLSYLEDASLQFNHVLTVSAVGPTAVDNGLELFRVLQLLPVFGLVPYVILIEPGVYEMGDNDVRLSPKTSMAGFDRDNTVIKLNTGRLLVSNASLKNLTIEKPKETGSSAAIIVSGEVFINNLNVTGRWAISGTQSTSLQVTNSNLDSEFSCIRNFKELLMDAVNCNTLTTFIESSYGAGMKVNSSSSNGNIIIRDSAALGGLESNVIINDSDVGYIFGTNITPPTQAINLNVTNSTVGHIRMLPTVSLIVKFSELRELEHGTGESFVSHSLIDVLNISGGISNVVNSQIGTLNDSGGSLTCPFSYDGSYSQLSGVSC